MAGRTQVGIDFGDRRSCYAAVERKGGRARLVAAGTLDPGERVRRALARAEAVSALRTAEAIAVALPAAAIEEAEEAFRWEVAKSGVIPPDSPRCVRRRGPVPDSGPPFLGMAASPAGAEARAEAIRKAGLSAAGVTLEVVAIERLLKATGKLPAAGTVLHVEVQEGTSVVAAFGESGLALRRTIRTAPVSAESIALDLQRTASYLERKLSLRAAEAVYLSGESSSPALAEAISRELRGLRVEEIDPLAAVDIAPGVDLRKVRERPAAFAVAFGLALHDPADWDFLPPASRGARTVRKLLRVAELAALSLVPLVVASGLYARYTMPEIERRGAETRAAYGAVELLRTRTHLLESLNAALAERRAALERLGDRDIPFSKLVLALVSGLPEEAYLTELDLGGETGALSVRMRGEIAASDESTALAARERLRKAAGEIAPGAQVVFDAAARSQGRVRVSFSIDGVLKGGRG